MRAFLVSRCSAAFFEGQYVQISMNKEDGSTAWSGYSNQVVEQVGGMIPRKCTKFCRGQVSGHQFNVNCSLARGMYVGRNSGSGGTGRACHHPYQSGTYVA